MSGATTTLNSRVALTGADTSLWNAFVGRIKTTGEAKAYRSVNGAMTTGAETAALARGLATRSLLIGRELSASFTGTGNLAMLAIFTVDLTEAQVTDALAYLRQTWGPAVGITTL